MNVVWVWVIALSLERFPQEGRGTGDGGAIFYNLYNWSFDMSDLAACVCVCVRAAPVESDPFTPLFITTVPGYHTN